MIFPIASAMDCIFFIAAISGFFPPPDIIPAAEKLPSFRYSLAELP